MLNAEPVHLLGELVAELLEEVLGQIFDMKLAEQRKRIDKMSGELDDLQQRLQERTSSRERIIERRLRELKGERDTLDW